MRYKSVIQKTFWPQVLLSDSNLPCNVLVANNRKHFVPSGGSVGKHMPPLSSGVTRKIRLVLNSGSSGAYFHPALYTELLGHPYFAIRSAHSYLCGANVFSAAACFHVCSMYLSCFHSVNFATHLAHCHVLQFEVRLFPVCSLQEYLNLVRCSALSGLNFLTFWRLDWGPGPFSGQSTRNLLWTNWHWDRFSPVSVIFIHLSSTRCIFSNWRRN